MATGIGARLKMARSLADLSQRDVAARMELSPMMISKYENEQVLPGSDVLIRLARTLDQPVEFFLRGPAIPAITPADRQHATLRTTDASIAQLQSWVERYLAVESLYPADELVHFALPSHFPYPIETLTQVEEAADALRHAWGLGDFSIDNMTELLEDKGIKVGVVAELKILDRAAFQLEDGAPIIASTVGSARGQQRLDLACALGTMILRIPAASGPEEIDEEVARQRFARAFLIPRAAAYRELGQHRHRLDIYELHSLAGKYGVTLQSWIERARELGIMSEARAKQALLVMRQNRLRRQGAGETLPNERPQRLTRLVLRALAEEAITPAGAVELLGMSWSEFLQHQAQMHRGMSITEVTDYGTNCTWLEA